LCRRGPSADREPLLIICEPMRIAAASSVRGAPPPRPVTTRKIRIRPPLGRIASKIAPNGQSWPALAGTVGTAGPGRCASDRYDWQCLTPANMTERFRRLHEVAPTGRVRRSLR
jgi:hypothetical protein